MQPRDAGSAARALFALTSAGAAVTLFAAVLTLRHERSGAWFAALTVALAIAVGGSRCLRLAGARNICWSVLPVLYPAAIAAVGLALPDRRLHPEVFLWFPAMYGVRQLRRSAAWVTIGICAAFATGLYFVRYEPATAALDALYFDSTLVAITVRLTVTWGRFDRMLRSAKREASHDPLTGLMTRRSLELAAEQILPRAVHRRGAALVLIDIDHFKQVNDTYGHPMGDAVLAEIAQVLRNCARDADLVARLGGDELAILFDDAPFGWLPDRLETIRSAVAEHVFGSPAEASPKVSVSIGYAHTAQGATSLRELYVQADRALYTAKRLGRNRAVVFTDPIRTWEPAAG
jgi:diguanylate cyclase (GGDEF)-like protein